MDFRLRWLSFAPAAAWIVCATPLFQTADGLLGQDMSQVEFEPELSEPISFDPASEVVSESQPPNFVTKKVIGPDGKEQEIHLPEGVPLPPGFKEVGSGDAAPTQTSGANSGGSPTPGAVAPIRRPSSPPSPPERKEFDVRPDEDGNIQFSFRNQSWPDLLKWLADVSDMTLDWQELPGDHVNISTPKKFTLEQARDLFNLHLLSRGYTLVEVAGAIHVCKVDKLNPALIPKVEPDLLSSLPQNRFVRTTFTLQSLMADDVVTEMKSLCSPNGKLTALSNTNRIEAMDSVINLREIYRILSDEQSEAALANLAREFPLVHVRAEDAKSQLERFLGIKSDDTASMSPEQMAMMQQQQQMQMQMQMQMQAQQGGVPSKPKRKGDASEVLIAANARQNSLIVNAQPNQMAIIAAFIKRWDVPSSNESSLTSIQTRMRVYRLATLSPERFAKSLREMDVLEPSTRLEVDQDNSAIIAYASIADQYTIQKILERLDGSAREFSVIQLRRLDAEQVAGTIKSLMITEPKSNSNEDRYGYFYYDYYSMRSNQNKKKSDDAFRVGANVKDNQLLLWANESELKEVQKFLVKLGEIPADGADSSPIRVIDAARSPETYEFLKRIQRQWEQMSPNPIILPDSSLFQNLPRTDSQDSAPAASSQPESQTQTMNAPRNVDPGLSQVATTFVSRQVDDPSVNQLESTNPPPNSDYESRDSDDANLEIARFRENSPLSRPSWAGQPPNAPAIQISIDARGNIVLYSEDREALDRLQSMIMQSGPPKRPYRTFQIKHARASWIRLNLEDYFKDVDDKPANNSRFIFWDFPPQEQKKDDRNLGKRSKMRFIDDNDTKTLIVQGADEETLKTIEELIELWDKPTEDSNKKARFTKLVRIQYSQADAIVEAVKDAYRDLLSSNDKSFQEGGGGGGGGKKESKRDGDDSISGGAMRFSGFSGKLSLGIDRVTNSIIVFAEGEDLLNLVVELIEDLDQAAKPSGSMRVVKLDANMSGKAIERALKAIVDSARNKSPDPQQQQQQPQNGSTQPTPPPPAKQAVPSNNAANFFESD